MTHLRLEMAYSMLQMSNSRLHIHDSRLGINDMRLGIYDVTLCGSDVRGSVYDTRYSKVWNVGLLGFLIPAFEGTSLFRNSCLGFVWNLELGT